MSEEAKLKKALLIGEMNPYGSNPRHALFHLPERATGHRLQDRILQVSAYDYYRNYDRMNLCVGKWSIKDARLVASIVRKRYFESRVIVLLGAKVCSAFGLEYEPFAVYRRRTSYHPVWWASGAPWPRTYVVIPHPSGLNRLWNDKKMYDRARRVLRETGAL